MLRRNLVHMLVLCTLTGVLCSAAARAEMSLQPVGKTIGLPPYQVVVQGDYAYCAADVLEAGTEVSCALEVFSIADPTAPALAGLLKIGPKITDLVARGSYVYLASGGDVKAVDVSNPAAPSVVWSTALDPAERTLCLVGDYLYVAEFFPESWNGDIRIFSLAHPAVPVEVGTYPLAAHHIAVSGSQAYVSAQAAFVVLNVSTPTAPHEAGRTELIPDQAAVAVTGGIAIAGDYAYVANGQLYVVDISDPAAPAQVGCYWIPGLGWSQYLWAADAAVSGSSVYVHAEGDMLIAAVDVSTPSNPTLSTYLDASGTDISVAGDHAFVAGGVEGLRVLSLADPLHPQEVGKADTPAFTHKVKLPYPRVAGDQYVYGAGWGRQGMTVLDVSQPAAPSVVAGVGANLRSLLVADGYAYLGAYGMETMLSVYDVSDPTSPAQVALPYSLPVFESTEGLAKLGGYLYVCSTDTLSIVDVHDPASATVVGSLAHLSSLRQVTVDPTGHYAFVSSGNNGIRSIDISDSRHPVLLATLDTPGWADEVLLAGSYLYVGDGDSLRIMDVSNPAAPHEVGSWTCPGLLINDAELVGSYLYLADAHYGLRVIGLATPANPIEVKNSPLPLMPSVFSVGLESGPSGVTACDGYIYVADFGWGVYSFRLEDTFADVSVDSWATDAIERCVSASIVNGFPNGTYQPDRFVTRSQMAIYIARALAGGEGSVLEPPPGTQTFPDVDSASPAYKYVEYCAAQNVVEGFWDGNYKPGKLVNRGQMAVFVARAKGWVHIGDDMTQAPQLFSDVPAGFSSGTAILACMQHGVVQGYPDGTYHPERSVRRDQMAAYVARAFQLLM